VLEKTSRGDLRLVEIQVKVEICRVLTCCSTSLTVGPHICADLLFHSHACFLALIYFVLLEAVTCPLLVEDIHSAIKKREGQQPDLGFAILINSYSAIFGKAESAKQRAERAAPSVRKKRDLLLQKSVHPLSLV
jgi:hypothetical protein